MQPISIQNVEKREFLVQNEKYKMICFVFESGEGLPDHTHNGLAAIQVVSGDEDIQFVDGKQFSLSTGDVLGFDAKITHNVIAKEKSRVIVTIIF